MSYCWYEINKARFINEYDSVNDFLNENPFVENGRWSLNANEQIEFCCSYSIHGNIYPLRLIYPVFYPEAPIAILADEENPVWTTHQYGSGVLCLEWGPDNWNTSISGCDMLLSAYKLLMTESPKSNNVSTVPSLPNREQFTIGQNTRYERVLLCLSSIEKMLISKLDSTLIRLVYAISPNKDVYRFAALNIDGEEKLTFRAKSVYSIATGYINDIYAVAYKQDTLERDYTYPLVTEIIDAQKLKSDIEYCDDKKGKKITSTFIFLTDGDKLKFFKINFAEEKLTEITIIYDEDERSRSPYNEETVTNKKVAIVGLGSLGSKIAVSLARSGIESFVLIDDDVFMPCNIQRHELDNRHVGQMKVEAVATRIIDINPMAVVETEKISLTTMESNLLYDKVLQKLAGTNVIIDATANNDCFYVLSNICASLKRTLVWGQVYAGGLGGFVAHYNPLLYHGPLTIVYGLQSYFRDNPYNNEGITESYQYRIGDIVYIATDSDVGLIASMMSKIVHFTLFSKEQEINSLSPVYIFGNKKEWVFDKPFEMIALDIEPNNDSENDKSADLSSEEKNYYSRIIENIIGEKDAETNSTK